MVRGLIAALVFTLPSSALADPGTVDGDRMAECYAAYVTLVALGDAKKIPEAERAAAAGQSVKAEAKAVALYMAEGLNEELAREQLEGRAQFMRSETRDLGGTAGIYGTDDVRKLASDCDALVGA